MKVRFSLPVSNCLARLAVTSNGTLNDKDYVLKVRFPGIELSREQALGLNFSYSDSFKAPFVYNSAQGSSELGKTAFFRIPEDALEAEVEVERWQRNFDISPITALQMNVKAPWSSFNHLTLNGVEVTD